MALWFGWFGFNGGSQLAWGGDDTVAATTIVLFTNLSAAAGAVGALVTTWIWYGKPDIVQTLNGALAGLVSICLLYTSPSPRDKRQSRMPSSA